MYGRVGGAWGQADRGGWNPFSQVEDAEGVGCPQALPALFTDPPWTSPRSVW